MNVEQMRKQYELGLGAICAELDACLGTAGIRMTGRRISNSPVLAPQGFPPSLTTLTISPDGRGEHAVGLSREEICNAFGGVESPVLRKKIREVVAHFKNPDT